MRNVRDGQVAPLGTTASRSSSPGVPWRAAPSGSAPGSPGIPGGRILIQIGHRRRGSGPAPRSRSRRPTEGGRQTSCPPCRPPRRPASWCPSGRWASSIPSTDALGLPDETMASFAGSAAPADADIWAELGEAPVAPAPRGEPDLATRAATQSCTFDVGGVWDAAPPPGRRTRSSPGSPSPWPRGEPSADLEGGSTSARPTAGTATARMPGAPSTPPLEADGLLGRHPSRTVS